MGNKLSNQKNHHRDNSLKPYIHTITNPEYLDWKKGLTPSEITKISKLQENLPVEVMPYLYLGSNKEARDLPLLSNLRITHIYNVTSSNSHNDDIDYGSIMKVHDPAEDEEEYAMLPRHLQKFLSFIVNARRENGQAKILVHCTAGLNRSGVLAAAVLMLTEAVPVLEAVRKLRLARGNMVLCNQGFCTQLVELAVEHEFLGDKPAIDIDEVEMQQETVKQLVKLKSGLDKMAK